MSARSGLAALLLGATLCAPAWAFEPPGTLPATGTIELAFTPEQDAAGLVVRAIDAASLEVLVQAFSFTHERIAEALLRARQRGVPVQVLVDPEQAELIGAPLLRRLVKSGLPVFADAGHSAAHNKVIVIDADGPQPVLLTGSFNFTFAAQYRNAENLLVFRGNPALAAAYRDNWMRHRGHSAGFEPAPSR